MRIEVENLLGYDFNIKLDTNYGVIGDYYLFGDHYNFPNNGLLAHLIYGLHHQHDTPESYLNKVLNLDSNSKRLFDGLKFEKVEYSEINTLTTYMLPSTRGDILANYRQHAKQEIENKRELEREIDYLLNNQSDSPDIESIRDKTRGSYKLSEQNLIIDLLSPHQYNEQNEYSNFISKIMCGEVYYSKDFGEYMFKQLPNGIPVPVRLLSTHLRQLSMIYLYFKSIDVNKTHHLIIEEPKLGQVNKPKDMTILDVLKTFAHNGNYVTIV